LPKSLTHLTFGFYFNQKVDKLPETLTQLCFDTYFNQPIDNLPKSLTHLTFVLHSCFNQPIDNLPKNLTHLTFGINFNQPVDNLPENLTHLKLHCKNNKIIIPKNVSELYIMNNNILINNLPEHIEKLFIKFSIVKNKIENLPITIKEIIIENKEYKKYIKKPFDAIITVNSNLIHKSW
jgi:hypothetical protein